MNSSHWPTRVKGSYWSKTVESFDWSTRGEKFLLNYEIFSLVYDEWKDPFGKQDEEFLSVKKS